MKTLENHTLLYDKDCPLCKVYTSGFIKTNMLDNNGRKPFCEISKQESYVDLQRATNEIALVDTKNKTVIYGIDSLLKVTGNSFPIIERIGNIKPIKFLLKKLYSFISYNRKVIIPSKKTNTKLACVPTFNYRYRFLYIVFATLITTITLYNFSKLVPNLPETSVIREFIIAFGQIVFQSFFLLRKNRETIVNYMGNLMTVSLMGSLLLIPLLMVNSIISLPQLIILGWFGITILTMFIEHFKRVKLLELPSYLCYTWALYRIIILVILLNL